jgi:hypothetical protein
VRLIRAWQATSDLTRKGVALGLVFLVLLPVISTADDFHTCALHGLAAKPHASQFYEPNPNENADQAPCLACYWQSVTDPAYQVGQLCVEFYPLCSLPVMQHAAAQHGTHPVRHGRAPPWLVFSD